LIIIVDRNGFIDGMQSIVPRSKTHRDRYYNYATSPYTWQTT
jgi:hypothetical protein